MSEAGAYGLGDLARQIVTTFGLVAALGVAAGQGGKQPVVADGAFASDATLLAPAGPAFVLWVVIYFGLIGYVIWQWRPLHARQPRIRRIGWPAAATLYLNAWWLLASAQAQLWLTVVIIGALVVVLGVIGATLARRRRRTWTEWVAVDATFGLYLGWICIAAVANVTTVVQREIWSPEPLVAQLVAVIVLTMTTAIAFGVLWGVRGNLATGFAMTWGVAWIAAQRLVREPASILVGGVAVVSALLIMIAAPMIKSNLRMGAERGVPLT